MCVWHGSFICVWHDSFTCVWHDHSYVYDVTHSYVKNGSFMCVWHVSREIERMKERRVCVWEKNRGECYHSVRQTKLCVWESVGEREWGRESARAHVCARVRKREREVWERDRARTGSQWTPGEIVCAWVRRERMGGAGEDRFSSTCRSLVTLSLHMNLNVKTYDSHLQHLLFEA